MRPHRDPHKRFHVYLPVATYEDLAALAVAHQRSISAEMTVALDAYRQHQHYDDLEKEEKIDAHGHLSR